MSGTRFAGARLEYLHRRLSAEASLPNASDLSRDLGVTVKTIHRDIAFLRRENDVEFDLGRNCYVLRSPAAEPAKPILSPRSSWKLKANLLEQFSPGAVVAHSSRVTGTTGEIKATAPGTSSQGTP